MGYRDTVCDSGNGVCLQELAHNWADEETDPKQGQAVTESPHQVTQFLLPGPTS